MMQNNQLSTILFLERGLKNLLEITREDGVRDLPNLVKIKFAHALQEERNGDNAKAWEYLLEAIRLEIISGPLS